MTTQSKILIVSATAAVLLGVVVLVFAVTASPRMAMIDAGILIMKYDPNGAPECTESRKYAGLYRMTESFIGERNRVTIWFLCTLGLSSLALGGIVLAWSVDRERLCRKVGDPKQQDVNKSGA